MHIHVHTLNILGYEGYGTGSNQSHLEYTTFPRGC